VGDAPRIRPRVQRNASAERDTCAGARNGGRRGSHARRPQPGV
jgi:hypothetical protein